MIRVLTLAVFLFPVSKAHAFVELFEGAPVMPPESYYQYYGPANLPEPTACKIAFGWGRGTVVILNLESQRKSDCTFSHTERIQLLGSTSFRQAVFFQHFTCTDNTSAFYSTNWMGGEFSFRHRITTDSNSLKCD